MGKTKRVAGRVMGNRRLEREGRAQQTTGKEQGVVRRAGKKVEEAFDKLGTKVSKRRERAGARPSRARQPKFDREF